MFEGLAKHRNIFVTGPHRSGTTIAARMIAADTGHDLVIEDDFSFSRLDQLAMFVQSYYSPIVVQCPFLADIIHDLKYLIDVEMEDSLVVFMHRYKRDIEASEERARVDFVKLGASQKRRYHTDVDEHISDVRYTAWHDQCQVIPNAMDLGYESLSEHPMWIEDRSGLPFGHNIIKKALPRIFVDGINSLQNI